MKFKKKLKEQADQVSLPVWGAWIEIFDKKSTASGFMSLPVWGAWIEILMAIWIQSQVRVAPRMGGVD